MRQFPDPLSEPSTTPGAISSIGSEVSTPQRQAEYATERAMVLFGAYRRGDANDPDAYVASIAAVLALYEPELMRWATDPRTGISTTEKFASFMPNSGELKAFCDAEAARRRRVAEYATIPPVTPRSALRLSAPPKRPGYRANVLVRQNCPRYSAMKAATETADPYDWKWAENGEDLWVNGRMLG